MINTYLNKEESVVSLMQPNYQSTTAFYTLDGCHSSIVADVFQALISNTQNSTTEWEELCKNQRVQARFRTQGIDDWSSRNEIQWDDPTVLFTLSRMLNEDNLPIMLGQDRNRERFGRFPHHTGSAVHYIRENIRSMNPQSNELFEDLTTHLDYLLTRCHPENVGDDRYVNGKAGLNIMGFLTFDEVKTLRSTLLGGGWSVARDEPIDGGVRDAIRHLNALLLAAERRGAGLIHRKHA